MDKKKKIIIIASCVVAVIVIGLVVFLLTRDNKKSDTPKPTPAVAKESFTISFDTDGGEKLEDLKVEKGKEFTLPTPTKDGYTFDGWYLEDEKVDESYSFTKDVTLVAKWTEETKTLKVVFDSNGGSKVKDMTFTCTDGAATLKNLPTPTKDKYEFRAWEDKHGKAILNGASITCDGDLKLYAAWEAKTEYYCDEGTLDGTKCIITKEATKSCPDGTREDGDKCVKLSDHNDGTRTCKPQYIEGHDYNGDYYKPSDAAPSTCVYAPLNMYTDRDSCVNAAPSNPYGWYNGKCYKKVVTGNPEYTTQCGDGYTEYSSADLISKFNAHMNSGCYKTSSKISSCSDGYTLKDGKCVKTVSAKTK